MSYVNADGGSGVDSPYTCTGASACPAGYAGSISFSYRVYKTNRDQCPAISAEVARLLEAGQSENDINYYLEKQTSYKYGTFNRNCVVSNTPPTVSDVVMSLNEDTTGSITLSAHDSDSPPPTVFEIVTPPNPAFGSAYISGTTLFFTPSANWSGTTSLTYRAQDSAGAWSAPATVTISVNPVNDPPVAEPKTLIVDEDTTGSVVLSATDIDSPPPTVFQIFSAPNAAHGTAYISGSTLVFTPAKDWNGATTLTYGAQDSAGAWSAPATVTIVVNPVNDAPVAQPKNLVIDEDTTGSVVLTATDIDSPPPSVFQIVAGPNAATGTASISGSTLTFTPAKDWNGSTSLTYRAQDSAGAWSEPATVTIVVNPVNDAPVAQGKNLVIDEDTTGSVVLTATDIDSPPPSVFQIVAGPNAATGTASISGSTLTFTPAKDWNGSTSLTYRAQDSAGAWSEPATVTIVVNPVNDPPVAQPKNLVIDEDTTGSVVLTATDIDSPPPSVFQIVAGPNAATGTASISGSTLTFTPVKDWNGSTSLTYRAQDSSGAWSEPATVTIIVNPVNDPPVAQPKSLTIDEDTPGSVVLTATDIDSPAPTIFQIVTPPDSSHGTATLSGSTLTFNPAQDWNGSTSLTYRAQDDAGAWSLPVTVTIVVRPVNDRPVKVGGLKIQTNEGFPATVRATVLLK
ncbi:tandem-95 repeat protein [Pseudomonas sp. Irchel 3E13]|uniref:tandem-95 repeat protein n=1 Tax=Pseudomonas sp. Irchel 3E13 TaxID=2008975 RepID=UPI00135BED17|nr:Ig-like domain-containing protein [Pseudomonas sp. Irchel 3E13]